MTHRQLIVKQSEAGTRLDAWLAQRLGYSREWLASQIREAKVLVDGRAVKPSFKFTARHTITLKLQRPTHQLVPEATPLDIIYQDSELVVLNKPAGVVVYPAGRHTAGTLANALADKFSNFYVVHRLDKDTSGVMLVALTPQVAGWLRAAFKNRQISKTYVAAVRGRVVPTEASLDLPIKRGRAGKFEVHRSGRTAQSRYRVLGYLTGATWLEVMPESGRTHQIRVHLAALGHPVLGDTVYGSKTPGLTRQFLHASQIEFSDWHGQARRFSTPLPPDLKKFLDDAKR